MKYQKGTILVKKNELFPQFLKIEDIFLIANGDVVMCCQEMHTVGLVDHLHSYEIVELNRTVLVTYSDLLDHHPLDIYCVNIRGAEKKIVRMRYDLTDCEKQS